MINNILFDFGGVILNINHKLTEDAFRELGIENFEQLYSQAVQNQLFDKLEKGQISPGEFREEIRKIYYLTDPQIDKAWNAILLDIPEERIKVLEAVKNNYRTFLLSNSNAIHYDVYMAELKEKYGYEDFSPLFEKVYFSFQIGKRKPDNEIFEFVLKENNLIPEETLFIEDSIQHIKSAAGLGIQTYLLEPNEEISGLFTNGKLR